MISLLVVRRQRDQWFDILNNNYLFSFYYFFTFFTILISPGTVQFYSTVNNVLNKKRTLQVSQSTIFVLFTLILKLPFTSTNSLSLLRSKWVEKRLTQIANLPCKEAEIYTTFLLGKLFHKCLEKKLCNITLIFAESQSC